MGGWVGEWEERGWVGGWVGWVGWGWVGGWKEGGESIHPTTFSFSSYLHELLPFVEAVDDLMVLFVLVL